MRWSRVLSTVAAPASRSRAPFLASGLAAAALAGTAAYAYRSKANAASGPFSPEEFRDFKLQEIKQLNHNSSIFRFELAKGQSTELPIASCVVVKATVDGKDEIRPYTPVNSNEDLGYVDFLVKKYDTGVVSKYFHQMKAGDKLPIKGPFGKWKYVPGEKKAIGMVAGGTGITPMLQLVREIFRVKDNVKINLVFANITEDDILLKGELDKYAKENPNFNVHYVLEKPPAGWSGSTGFISKDTLKKYLPAPSKDSVVLVCGPPGMMKAISGEKVSFSDQGPVEGLLKDLGYSPADIYKF